MKHFGNGEFCMTYQKLHNAEAAIPSFYAEDSFWITGRGLVYTVRNYEGPLDHPNELRGKSVYINNKLWFVSAVETFAVAGLPYRMGFGLLVRDPK